jgi:general secretion pathway protein L
MTFVIRLPLERPTQLSKYSCANINAAENRLEVHSDAEACRLVELGARKVKDMVVLVPIAALSWHCLDMPPYMHKLETRMRLVVQSLLEQKVLDDAATLHMALQADWRTQTRVWICVCDKEWILAHIQMLESVGVRIQRIVPELVPAADDTLMVQVWDEPDGEAVWFCSKHGGVWNGGTLDELPPLEHIKTWSSSGTHGIQVESTPPMLDKARAVFGPEVKVMSSVSQWSRAIGSSWDMGQFDLARYTKRRSWSNADSRFTQSMLWGVCLIVLMQLVAVNIWSWRTQAHWKQQQSQITAVVREVFPEIPVILDPVKQMEKGVDQLALSHQRLARNEFFTLLAGLTSVSPNSPLTLNKLEFKDGRLHIEGGDSAQLEAWLETLDQQKWRWTVDGPVLTLEPQPI